ncbi:uncharacterized protein ISCGN_010331 [Ixodes scapularis]
MSHLLVRDSNIFNKEVQVRWEGEKHPARIVAIGSPAQMEKKCKLMIKGACNGAGDQVEYCENCAALEQEKKSLKSDIDHLQEENARLKAIVDYATSQRDVVEGYTCKKFKLPKEGPVRTSLSSLLNKEADKEKP